jgi:hypothetical protein
MCVCVCVCVCWWVVGCNHGVLFVSLECKALVVVLSAVCCLRCGTHSVCGLAFGTVFARIWQLQLLNGCAGRSQHQRRSSSETHLERTASIHQEGVLSVLLYVCVFGCLCVSVCVCVCVCVCLLASVLLCACLSVCAREILVRRGMLRFPSALPYEIHFSSSSFFFCGVFLFIWLCVCVCVCVCVYGCGCMCCVCVVLCVCVKHTCVDYVVCRTLTNSEN